MTKPTIDERIVPLLGALALIDELKEDLDGILKGDVGPLVHETHVTHLKAKLDAFMQPEEAIVLRKLIAELEAESREDMAHAEVQTLRGAMKADDERLRAAEKRVFGDVTWGCDAPEHMADEVERLKAENARLKKFARLSSAWLETELAACKNYADGASELLGRRNQECVEQEEHVVELEAEVERLRKVLDKLPESWVEANDE